MEWSSSGNTNLNTRKFTGYERDATGLDYAEARMYNSGRGRFIQPDPVGMKSVDLQRPQTLNRYSYVQNDPANLIDPGGTDVVIWDCETTRIVENDRWREVAYCSSSVFRDPWGRSGGGSEDSGRGGVQRPCDIPVEGLSQDERAVVAAILGEATSRGYLGQKQYSQDQYGPLQRVGASNGQVITEDTFTAEMFMIVSALYNRLDSGKYGSTLFDVASSSQIVGYQNGEKALSDPNFAQLNPIGSDRCEQMRMAMRVLATVKGGTKEPTVMFWKAVIQKGQQNSWIVRKFEEGDIARVGFTDFSTRP